MKEQWWLMSGRIVVGTIDVSDVDQPWFVGRFVPEAAFAEFSDAFAQELELVDGDLEHQIDQWERVYRSIRDRMQLVGPDGNTVPEFLLHIRGTEAWFRYSDIPFE
jgi:hypothetical protein